MITIINKYTWVFGQNNCSDGGQIGQITRCRLNGIEFWVREIINGVNSFFISSGERQGDKEGLSKVRNCRQVLELLCPPFYWDAIACEVRKTDPFHRPVKKNSLFNKSFIKKIIASQ